MDLMQRGFLAAAVLILAGCQAGEPALTVASKNFSENVFLAELVAQQVERRTDYPVVRRLNLGGTFICHQALISGQVDLYPEYTGTALTAILELPTSSDRQAVFETVSRDYEQRFQARWAAPFGFNNTFALLVRGDAPAALQSISDLASDGRDLVLGYNFEFEQRSDGFAGLSKTYGLELTTPSKTLDLSLVYKALADKEIDVAVGNSTHGLIDGLGLRQLADDRNYFPPYDAAMVVREDAFERFPQLGGALAELAGALSQNEMRRINRRLDVDQVSPAEAAREFLERLGR